MYISVSFHPVEKKYPGLFGAGSGKGGEKEEWQLHLSYTLSGTS